MNPRTEIRRFNRFYTRLLGVLNHHILDSPFSLTEARVLYEIGNAKECTATDLISLLDLDRGHLSRILKRFQASGLVRRTRAGTDGRFYFLHLTDHGRSTLAELVESSDRQISQLIGGLTPHQQVALVNSMKRIETLLSKSSGCIGRITIRPSQAGDIGFLAQRLCEACSREHGFDSSFESYVLSGLAQYAEKRDVERDSVWVSDADEVIVGSIGVVGVDRNQAELRWFLVDHGLRNQGIGKELLRHAVEFCGQRYAQVLIRTFNSSDSARYLYQHFGFRLQETETLFMWGRNVTVEQWHLGLPW